MPKVTVYVSDELKARMDKLSGAEWSATAQRAFEREIDRMQSQTSVSTIDDAVIRLRASRNLEVASEAEHGKKTGTRWALKRATFRELSDVAALDLSALPDGPLFTRVIEELYPEDLSLDLWEEEVGTAQPGDALVEAFVEAAAGVFDQVEGKI